MSLTERNEALAAFRNAQKLAAKVDRAKYARKHPTPAPVDPRSLTAAGRAILRAEVAA